MATLARPVPESRSPFRRGWIPGEHRGLDYGWIDNNDIVIEAAAAGRVIDVVQSYPDNANRNDNGGWGNRIRIDHGNGIVTTYNHLRRGSAKVSPGEWVGVGHGLAVMGNSGKSTGRHLHFELYLNGTRVDPEPYRSRDLPGLANPAPSGGGGGALSQLQRRFSTYTFRRSAPSSQSDKIIVDGKDGVAAGEIGNFTHWTHGENVLGSDIWLKGVSGGWFHSSGLERGTDVSGLQEVVQESANVQSFQRIVRAATLNERREATSESELLRTFKKGEVLDFKAWKHGQVATIEGVRSDIWFQGRYSGTWFNAAGFTSQDVAGLEDANSSTPEPTTPPVVTPPAPVLDLAFKDFKADTILAKWIGSPNYNYRDPRPASEKPRSVTLHWMDGTLAGTDSQFQKYGKLTSGRGDGSASNYGVGLSEIHQYVRERDYQQADGNTEANRYSISIEHEAGTNRPVADSTVALSATLLADIAKRYGWGEFVLFGGDLDAFRKLSYAEQQKVVTDFIAKNPTQRLVFPHKAWASTACPGTLPLSRIVSEANKILASVNEPEPQPEPQPEETASGIIATIQSLLAKLAGLLGKKS
jgi:hypothetical protein